MISSPGSPESNPDPKPEEPDPESSRDDYLASVAAKNRAAAAGIRTRNLVIALLGTALVVLAGAFLWLGLHFQHSGDQAAERSAAVLGIAKGFQCQVNPSTKGCPALTPAQRQAQSGQSAAIDVIIYRVDSFIATELGKPPPPKPADVP